MLRKTRRATWIALAALGAAAPVAPRAVGAIVAALTATIGIAHGATDAAMLERTGFRPRGGRTAISIAYGAVAIAVYAVARRRPAAASRVLRAVSWAHFGSGDAAFARACGSQRFELLESFVRGGLPLSIGGRGAASAWSAVAAALYAAVAAVRDDVPDALDVAIPALTLYLAPARLGFGCYFAAWHSPRHVALLLERDSRGGSYTARLRRFARESAPNAALASAFGALAYVAGGRREAGDSLAAALILAITIPHQIAVWTIEYRVRLSRSGSARAIGEARPAVVH
jgi:hypothetical protein